MATTKIWDIQTRLDNVIDYIVNEKKTNADSYYNLHRVVEYTKASYKTEEQLYVTAINCSEDTILQEMMETKKIFYKEDGILGYHAFQSFKEGEVTPEVAHKIGIKLAEEIWGDRFQVVVTTHLNTHCVHNHFVLNSVSFIDGKKYYDNDETYALIRHTSDNLCREYGLSVLTEKPTGKYKIDYNKYFEKYAKKSNYHTQTKQDINYAITQSNTYKEFENLLKAMNYELIYRAGKLSIRRDPYTKNIRVARAFGDDYTVEQIKARIKTEKAMYEATPRGKLKKEEIAPVVGDKIEISILDEENKKAVIEKIYDRENYIKRPKMSNLTQIILVVSSKDPKPDLLLLDKQLAFAEFLKIKPIIVLNKVDLDKKHDFEEIEKVYKKIGYTVIKTQAKNLIGIDELKKYLKNNVNAFSGNSGVGKSTLINAIFQKELTEEGEISKKNKKGKNTTTSVKLYEIDENTYLADTPGFATFDISEINYQDLEKYFKEFVQYIENCEFIGCTHIKEQNCGIKKAVEQNEISQGRYQRYCKIYEELKEKDKFKY